MSIVHTNDSAYYLCIEYPHSAEVDSLDSTVCSGGRVSTALTLLLQTLSSACHTSYFRALPMRIAECVVICTFTIKPYNTTRVAGVLIKNVAITVLR